MLAGIPSSNRRAAIRRSVIDKQQFPVVIYLRKYTLNGLIEKLILIEENNDSRDEWLCTFGLLIHKISLLFAEQGSVFSGLGAELAYIAKLLLERMNKMFGLIPGTSIQLNCGRIWDEVDNQPSL